MSNTHYDILDHVDPREAAVPFEIPGPNDEVALYKPADVFSGPQRVDPYDPLSHLRDISLLTPKEIVKLDEDLEQEMNAPVIAAAGSNGTNFTLTDLGIPETKWIFGSTEDRVVMPMLISLLALCALVGNLIIILAPLRNRHRMRTGPYLMLLNISVADLLFIIFCVPTTVINHALPYRDDILSEFVCRFVHYVLFVSVYVGVYTLVVTSVFRLCSELLRSNFTSLLSSCNAVLSCTVIWAAFIVSHLNLLLQKDATPVFHEPFICVYGTETSSSISTLTRKGIAQNENSASDDISRMNDSAKIRTLWVTFLTCAFLIPLLLICSLSAFVLHIQGRRQPQRDSHIAGPSSTPPLNDEDSRQKRELTVLVMAAMVVRTLCWLPVQIFVMVDVFGMLEMSHIYKRAEMVAICFAFGSACAGPVVYGCTCDDFRLEFHRSLCCRKRGKGDSHDFVDSGSAGVPPGDEHTQVITRLVNKPNGQHYYNSTTRSQTGSLGMNGTIMAMLNDSSKHIHYS